jgi:hypothetical protein
MNTKHTTSVCLTELLPDIAKKWASEGVVIRSLVQDDDHREILVDLLEGWLSEAPFQRVLLLHPNLVNPLMYEKGEGEGSFFRRSSKVNGVCSSDRLFQLLTDRSSPQSVGQSGKCARRPSN